MPLEKFSKNMLFSCGVGLVADIVFFVDHVLIFIWESGVFFGDAFAMLDLEN